jgi:hypothetical protein
MSVHASCQHVSGHTSPSYTVLMSAEGQCAHVASANKCTLPAQLGAVGVWCGGGRVRWCEGGAVWWCEDEVRCLEAHMSQVPSGAHCLHSCMQRVCVVVVECGGRVVGQWGDVRVQVCWSGGPKRYTCLVVVCHITMLWPQRGQGGAFSRKQEQTSPPGGAPLSLKRTGGQVTPPCGARKTALLPWPALCALVDVHTVGVT